VILAVTDVDEAARWYERAHGARQLWTLGGVVGLEVEGAPFFLGQHVSNILRKLGYVAPAGGSRDRPAARRLAALSQSELRTPQGLRPRRL